MIQFPGSYGTARETRVKRLYAHVTNVGSLGGAEARPPQTSQVQVTTHYSNFPNARKALDTTCGV